MIEVLRTVKTLNLPDWWIGAGFVRSKVWDHLHNFKKPTPLPDIDVIYFDPNDYEKGETNSESTKNEKMHEDELKKLMPKPNWSVTNQARMHFFHKGDIRYKNSTEALSRWVETATCIGVRINSRDKLELTAPYGVEDLVNLKLRPVTMTTEGLKLFNQRIKKKKWLTLWPKLRVEI